MTASLVARTVDQTEWQWPLDLGGYDPNDGPPCSIERHACADDGWIAAQFLPQTEAQYRDWLSARDIIARTKPASEKGTHAENVEEFGGGTDSTHKARRPVALADYHVAVTEQRYLAEAGNASADVEVFLMGPVCLFPEDTNLALVGKGKRVEKNAAGDAVHRCRAADTQSESQY